MKRLYRSRDLLHPQHMMGSIDESAHSMKYIPTKDVFWFWWRGSLVSYIKVPKTFKEAVGKTFAKRLHDSYEDDCFNFIRNGDAESIPICICKAVKL